MGIGIGLTPIETFEGRRILIVPVQEAYLVRFAVSIGDVVSGAWLKRFGICACQKSFNDAIEKITLAHTGWMMLNFLPLRAVEDSRNRAQLQAHAAEFNKPLPGAHAL